MPYPPTARQTNHESEKTQRTRIICNAITTSIFLLSCVAVIISGQWADFAKKRLELRSKANQK